jgi:hypothetical protein
MIILDTAPKLPTDPTAVPTNREYHHSDLEAHAESSRSPSPNPTLPDYETSEAQQPSPGPKLSRSRKFWFSRVGRLISYALLIYSLVIVLVGVPMFVLVRFSQLSNCSSPPLLLVPIPYGTRRAKIHFRGRNHITSLNGKRTMMNLDPWAIHLNSQ